MCQLTCVDNDNNNYRIDVAKYHKSYPVKFLKGAEVWNYIYWYRFDTESVLLQPRILTSVYLQYCRYSKSALKLPKKTESFNIFPRFSLRILFFVYCKIISYHQSCETAM